MDLITKVGMESSDLELTLHPSYVLSLFSRKGGSYIKIAGVKKGCAMKVESGYLITDCGPEALYWSGSWFIEVLESEEPKGSVSWLLDLLREHYPKLGLAVDPQDPLHILISVFLSQATNYHANVIRWLRAIWNRTNDPSEAVGIAGEVAGSFQLKRLSQAFHCLSSSIGGDHWEIRRNLINCKYCGPKIADAFLLFGMADATSVPVDRHFISMVRKLRIWREFMIPRKEICKSYTCPNCPERVICLRWLASDSFGRLAGWVQTAFYLHERLYCRRKRCSYCSLKSECSSSQAKE